MPDFYSEPYIYLAGLTHKSALIAWGAFYFKTKENGKDAKLVDDDDLGDVFPKRHQSIGAISESYGEAEVTVWELKAGARQNPVVFKNNKNHCWVTGLKADTQYEYQVKVKNAVWAEGTRRDWQAKDKSLSLNNDEKYEHKFRTYPDPLKPSPYPLTFAVLGDYGVGIKEKSDKEKRQLEVAKALKKAVRENDVRFVLTTGDNIYGKKVFFGLFGTKDSGKEDDDWFFTYFQPYRYILNQIPVYPSMGNHDAGETESFEDRQQVIDNLYIGERIAGEEASGRASIDPGIFYRFRFGSDIEFVCIDTSKEDFFDERLYKSAKHSQFLESTFSADSPRWQFPFMHHPPFSAGPTHHNTDGMEHLMDLFKKGKVKIVFNGHEHNFQHSLHKGINYFISGAGGQLRKDDPDRFKEAHTLSWAAKHHFLLVTVEVDKVTIRPIAEIDDDNKPLKNISRTIVKNNESTNETTDKELIVSHD